MKRSPKPVRLTRRPKPRREGAVMMLVMLILLTGTAMAAVALQTTQHEIRAAGENRVAVQTQYVAEAALVMTTVWIDVVSSTPAFYKDQMNMAQIPTMAQYGEPEISTTNRAFANRTTWLQQRLFYDSKWDIPPISARDDASGRIPDPIGSFGPRSAYQPGGEPGTAFPSLVTADYVADIYDCQDASVGAAAGMQANHTATSRPTAQFYCVVTARGRSFMPGQATKTWTLDTSGRQYTPSRFSAAHDARTTIITPPIIL